MEHTPPHSVPVRQAVVLAVLSLGLCLAGEQRLKTDGAPAVFPLEGVYTRGSGPAASPTTDFAPGPGQAARRLEQPLCVPETEGTLPQ